MTNTTKQALNADSTGRMVLTLHTPRNYRAAAQQRARRRLRAFRRVCGTLSFLAFFFVLGVVGGVEHDTIALLPGTLYMTGGMAACWVLAWLAGAFK